MCEWFINLPQAIGKASGRDSLKKAKRKLICQYSVETN